MKTVNSNFKYNELYNLSDSLQKETNENIPYLKPKTPFALKKNSSPWKKIIGIAIPTIALLSGAIFVANSYFSGNKKIDTSVNQNIDYIKKKIHMFHITQAHKLPFGMKPEPEYIETVIQSQLNVAQAIKEHKNRPVLVEGLHEDAFFDPDNEFNKAAKMIFPQGLQRNSKELTSLQREFLYSNGAAFTMLYLGEIPRLYKSIHKEASDVIDQQISSGDFEKIFSPREKEAIDCVKEAASKQSDNPNKTTVLLVYGGGHNFDSYCKLENFDCEVINTFNNQKFNRPSAASVGASASIDSLLSELNNRLTEYPGDIDSRLKRADIFFSTWQYSKAKTDYEYVIKKYPANTFAAKQLVLITEKLEFMNRARISIIVLTLAALILPLYDPRENLNGWIMAQ